MGDEIMVVLRATLNTLFEALMRLLPRVFSALVVLIVGWLLAAALRVIVRKLLSWVRIDPLIERLGAGEPLRRSGLAPPHRLIAGAVYWLTLAGVALAVLQLLGIAGVDLLLADLLRYLPRILVSILVLLLGFAASNLAWRAALLAAVNARVRSAKLLGAGLRALVLVATAAIALDQLGIGSSVVHTAFAIAFGAVMLAFAIAFGLGGRHAARRFIEQRLLARGKPDDDEGRSHL